MVEALDGYEENGVVLDTTVERQTDSGTVQRETVVDRPVLQAGLVDQLFHTVASPPVAYLLLLIGLALLIFEFFTAGVGVAGVVGAACTILSCSGLAELPTRWWAVGLIVLAMAAFAVDVQVGIPRFWTGVGIVFTIVGSFWLYEPVSGSALRPTWLSLIAGIGGTMLTFIVGMPSMTRTRFATPTVGREWLIGRRRRGRQRRRPGGLRPGGRGAMAGAHEPGDAHQGRRAAARRRDRRCHARGRAARGRGARLPRDAVEHAPADVEPSDVADVDR